MDLNKILQTNFIDNHSLCYFNVYTLKTVKKETSYEFTKKLTKHGNSYALVIDSPILQLLGINNDTLLVISTPDGATIMITPVKSQEQQKKSTRTILQH